MPVPISRILTLLFVPYFLFVLTSLLTYNHPDIDPPYAFCGIIVGALAVCVLLALWSVKFTDAEGAQAKRFSLGSMMIVTGILAIHLAYFRLLPFKWNDIDRLDFWTLLALAIQFIFFCLFSTFVLAMFTDTVLDGAVRCKRMIARLFEDQC